ncbi:MAG: methyltransferase domain-containing protein [Pseudonocardiaceae bacterium]
MTITVPASTWQPLARRLADELDTDGDLQVHGWRDAVIAVPRHEFIPRYYLQDRDARPLRWTTHEPRDAESTQRWLDLVYSPTTLITDLADYADRGVQAPVSSSTKPDLMIRMLEALDVADGMRVLEIGTGTGYNAALLAHRLGSAQVCSVDIDPKLVSQARTRLSRLGYNPTLVTADGADGLADHAPFDRIIATCALFAVPVGWIDQLRPDGLALVHIEGPLGAGNLLALRRSDTQEVLQGKFLPWWGCFMRRRATAGATVGSPRPTRTTQPPATRHTTVDPTELDGGKQFPFLAQLYLPPGIFRSLRLIDEEITITELRAPDGSWCEINREPDVTGHYTVREAGPTPLWTNIETAWNRWRELSAPPWHEFGLTATPTEHHIWHLDPRNGPCWSLPIPRPCTPA